MLQEEKKTSIWLKQPHGSGDNYLSISIRTSHSDLCSFFPVSVSFVSIPTWFFHGSPAACHAGPCSTITPVGPVLHHIWVEVIIISKFLVLLPTKSSSSITLSITLFVSICTTNFRVSCSPVKTYLVKCLLPKISEHLLSISAECGSL